MSLMRKSLRSLSALAACGLIWGFPPGSNEASAKKKQNHAEESAGPGSLWTDPINLESRDLYYGSGGEKRAPQGGITFQKEDLSGTNPKMDVTDEAGVKWKLKLGSEARPGSRGDLDLVWAAGYFTADDYLLREIHIANLPGHLRRGSNEIHDGTTGNARVKRNPEGYEKKRNLELERRSLRRFSRVQRPARHDGLDQQLGSQGRQQRGIRPQRTSRRS